MSRWTGAAVALGTGPTPCSRRPQGPRQYGWAVPGSPVLVAPGVFVVVTAAGGRARGRGPSGVPRRGAGDRRQAGRPTREPSGPAARRAAKTPAESGATRRAPRRTAAAAAGGDRGRAARRGGGRGGDGGDASRGGSGAGGAAGAACIATAAGEPVGRSPCLSGERPLILCVPAPHAPSACPSRSVRVPRRAPQSAVHVPALWTPYPGARAGSTCPPCPGAGPPWVGGAPFVPPPLQRPGQWASQPRPRSSRRPPPSCSGVTPLFGPGPAYLGEPKTWLGHKARPSESPSRGPEVLPPRPQPSRTVPPLRLAGPRLA